MSDQPTNGKTVGDLAQEILNRIITDADFRQQIAKNPEETLAEAGYTAGDDVSGYVLRLGVQPLGQGKDLGPGGGGGSGKGLRPAPIEKPKVLAPDNNPKNL